MSVNEPLMKHRKDSDDTKTGVSPVLREQHGRYLFTGHAVSGVQEAWRLSGLSYGTWEPGRWWLPQYQFASHRSADAVWPTL